MTEVTRAIKALQAVHRTHLGYAMATDDRDYIQAMNAIFALLRALEAGEK